MTRSLPGLTASSALDESSSVASLGGAGPANPTQDYASVGGLRYRSNRSRRGLYDGKDIRSGNNVSFSMRSTKRKFKPNVFKKRVYRLVLRSFKYRA